MGEVKILEQWSEGEDGKRSSLPEGQPAPAGPPTPAGPPKTHSPKWVTVAIETSIIVLAVLLALLLRWQVYETAIVTSSSMESTLLINDRLLIDHRQSLHGNWQRGDVVLFETPETWAGSEEALVKRIVGLPGETVQIYGGQVYINSRPLTENYLKEGPEPEVMLPQVLGKGQYFVLGDNRNHSDDSRANGPVPDKNIFGRAIYRLGPFGRVGRLPAPGYDAD